MSSPPDRTDQMMALQKARIGCVIRLSQENAMILSLQQKVGGKEIEMMVAERAAVLASQLGERAADPGPLEEHLDTLRQLLAHHITQAEGMERQLKDIDGEIAALCQS